MSSEWIQEIHTLISNDKVNGLKTQEWTIRTHNGLLGEASLASFAIQTSALACFRWLISIASKLHKVWYTASIDKNLTAFVDAIHEKFDNLKIFKVWKTELFEWFANKTVSEHMFQTFTTYAQHHAVYEKDSLPFEKVLRMQVEELASIVGILGHYKLPWLPKLFDKNIASVERLGILLDAEVQEAFLWLLREGLDEMKERLFRSNSMTCFQIMDRNRTLPSLLLLGFDKYGMLAKNQCIFLAIIRYSIYDQGSLECACTMANRFEKVNHSVSKTLVCHIWRSIAHGTGRYVYEISFIQYLLSFSIFREMISQKIEYLKVLFLNLPHSQAVLEVILLSLRGRLANLFQHHFSDLFHNMIKLRNIDGITWIREKMQPYIGKTDIFATTHAVHAAAASGSIELFLFVLNIFISSSSDSDNYDQWSKSSVLIEHVLTTTFDIALHIGNLRMLSFVLECGFFRLIGKRSCATDALIHHLYFQLQCKCIQKSFIKERILQDIVMSFLNYEECCPSQADLCFEISHVDVAFLHSQMIHLNIEELTIQSRFYFDQNTVCLQNPTPHPNFLFQRHGD